VRGTKVEAIIVGRGDAHPETNKIDIICASFRRIFDDILLR